MTIVLHKRTKPGEWRLRPRIHARICHGDWYAICNIAAERAISPAVVVRDAIREYAAAHAPPAPVDRDEVHIVVPDDGSTFKRLLTIFGGNASTPTS